MAFNLRDGFNKYVDVSNKLGKTMNNVIGKDFFQEAKHLEEPKTFPPYDSFPQYDVPEPAQWSPLQGSEKEFSINGSTIKVSAELDTCLMYKSKFAEAAEYYTNRFKFKYYNCVNDFDSFVNFFADMYLEGLTPMAGRAYSLLLPFGVFNSDIETFTGNHCDNYNQAAISYATLAGIEATKNQNAKNLGNAVGGSVQMTGGGFGFKGAMKGAAQAEAFNIGMGLVGKLAEINSRMTQEEKAEVFSKFKQDVFFQEVYNDYFNTFYTLINTLKSSGIIAGIETKTDKEFETMILNLQNPMFPEDKLTPALVSLIQKFPFEKSCYELARSKFGETEEIKAVSSYFLG